MTQITLQLADELAQQVRTRAALEGKAVEDYVADIVQRDVMASPEEELQRLASFSDEDVLALADLKLTPEEDRRLGELLELNSEGQLPKELRQELDALVRLDMDGMLKKSLGCAEAVRRKLREPPV